MRSATVHHQDGVSNASGRTDFSGVNLHVGVEPGGYLRVTGWENGERQGNTVFATGHWTSVNFSELV